MHIHTLAIRSAFTAFVVAMSGSAFAADNAAASAAPMAKNLSEQKFAHFPDTPDCSSGTVLSGDPGKGPSLMLLKVSNGCVIPWHWHSSDEHVMLASGSGTMDMKDAKPVAVHSGAYAMMPGHQVHQFTCHSACVLFLKSDGVFDMHYVDTNGKEIPSADALKKKK